MRWLNCTSESLQPQTYLVPAERESTVETAFDGLDLVRQPLEAAALHLADDQVAHLVLVGLVALDPLEELLVEVFLAAVPALEDQLLDLHVADEQAELVHDRVVGLEGDPAHAHVVALAEELELVGLAHEREVLLAELPEVLVGRQVLEVLVRRLRGLAREDFEDLLLDVQVLHHVLVADLLVCAVELEQHLQHEADVEVLFAVLLQHRALLDLLHDRVCVAVWELQQDPAHDGERFLELFSLDHFEAVLPVRERRAAVDGVATDEVEVDFVVGIFAVDEVSEGHALPVFLEELAVELEDEFDALHVCVVVGWVRGDYRGRVLRFGR